MGKISGVYKPFVCAIRCVEPRERLLLAVAIAAVALAASLVWLCFGAPFGAAAAAALVSVIAASPPYRRMPRAILKRGPAQRRAPFYDN